MGVLMNENNLSIPFLEAAMEALRAVFENGPTSEEMAAALTPLWDAGHFRDISRHPPKNWGIDPIVREYDKAVKEGLIEPAQPKEQPKPKTDSKAYKLLRNTACQAIASMKHGRDTQKNDAEREKCRARWGN
jgi:hypothetical protein